MNIMVSAAATVTAIGTIGGGYFAIDATYVRRSEFQQISWQLAKEAIRDIRQKMRENPGDPDLPIDLQDQIDLLCRDFPDDRECKGDGK